MPFYGVITGSLFAYFSRASYNVVLLVWTIPLALLKPNRSYHIWSSSCERDWTLIAFSSLYSQRVCDICSTWLYQLLHIIICDFDWAGNWNLSAKCYHWIIFGGSVFLGIKPADCTALPKKHQHTCLKSKGRHGSGRGLNPWPPRSIKFKMVTGTSTITGKIWAWFYVDKLWHSALEL